MRAYPDIRERFAANYERIPGVDCWLWTGATSSNGYGHIFYKNKQESAHRCSYKLHVGEIPKDMCVLHRCDVKHCVNPAHLFLGTHQDNMADRNNKGRCAPASGDLNNSAKLTPQQVADIRADSRTGHALSVAHGVSEATISRIRNHVSWREAR